MIVSYRSVGKPVVRCALLLLLFVCYGCQSENVCPKEFNEMPGNIISISGPEVLSVGERVPITIGIQNTDSVCVQAPNVSVKLTGRDTLSIQANLHYLSKNTEGCDCLRDSVIYTLFYFTPTTTGNYHFIIARRLDSTLEPIGETPILNIIVP